MVNVIIVSRNGERQLQIQKELESLRERLPNMNVLFSHSENIHKHTGEGANILVYDVPEFNFPTLNYIRYCREIKFFDPIVIVSRIPYGYRGYLDSMKNVVVVEKPYRAENLMGVLCRLNQDALVASRQYPRHETHEKASLFFRDSKVTQEATIHNISRGGALVTCAPGDYRVGQLLRLERDIQDFSNQRTKEAKIAWIKHKEGDTFTSMGLQFAQVEEVVNFINRQDTDKKAA